MPELPEVEMVRRNLNNWWAGRTITEAASSGRHRGVADIAPVAGHRFKQVERIGKYLLADVGPQLLVVHLGMSGRFLRHGPEALRAEPGPHDHMRIATDDGAVVVFQDHRRFGRVFLSALDRSGLPPLGPDPTHVRLMGQQIREIFGGRRAPLKTLLMDQSIIAGIGNMYACEILWVAQLSPFRAGTSLTGPDHRRLAKAISAVLARAIAAGGATLDDYRGTSGAMGDFDRSFAVYGREGLKCRRCKHPVAAEISAGRITYWCRECQR